MARIKLHDTLEFLWEDIQPALNDAAKEIFPDAQFESRNLYRAFLKAVMKRQRDWVRVPWNLIDPDE
jgi:hypothetical protein